MKNRNKKKIFSAFAVLAISAATALTTVPLTACNKKDGADQQPAGDVVTIDTAAYGAVAQRTSGKKYFIAPDGKSTNSGEAIDAPKAVDFLASDSLHAGDTVYLLPGTYSKLTESIKILTNGEFNSYIRIINAALDKEGSGYDGNGKEVVLDFSAMTFNSNNRGVQIYGNYIYWYGIDICGAGDNGMYVGGSFNTVEYCEFYNNRDTGLQLGRSYGNLTSVNAWPNYNLIKNCTSHNNYDNETYGENADGFAAKLTVGYGNVFDGCIAYRNSDDGWDLYAKTDSGNIGAVIIYNCVAYENGYLEYTQRENNARFPTWKEECSEDENNKYGLDSYKTKDGDGNGFKLGGSVMEGDVVVYNCLSFQNRMHGVTDNSNPGFLKITNVTSYDNSAAIDDNRYVLNNDGTPTETANPNFGKVVSISNHDTHNNIDVARQTYSYNSVNRVLSVRSAIAKSLGTDAYRGSVSNSWLLGVIDKDVAKDKANVINGSIDADTKADPVTGKIGEVGKSQQALVASAVFEKLPITKEDTAYTHNIDGVRDLYTEENGSVTGLNAGRTHLTYRNDDGSVNMHDILAQKADFAHNLTKLGADKKIGSVLNKENWGEYTHFYLSDFVKSDAEDKAQATVDRAAEALTLSVEETAVYQNFDVPVKMLGCTIEWSVSSDAAQYLEVITEEGEVVIDESVSGSQYATIKVSRPLTDKLLSNALTATIKTDVSNNTASATRSFDIKLIGGEPKIGNIEVHAYENDVLTLMPTSGAEIDKLVENAQDFYDYFDIFSKKASGSVIIDQFSVCREPAIKVQNGLYDDVRYVEAGNAEGEYSDNTLVFYQKDATSNPVLVPAFTPSNAGVYTIIKSVTVNGADDEHPIDRAGIVYRIYVASASANVEFVGKPVITVNRDGFVVDGTPSSATGTLYVLTSPTEISGITAANIVSKPGVQKYDFRSTSISRQFRNANTGEYYIYMALANAGGKVTSQLYGTKINTVNISTTADFMKIAGGEKIGQETPSETIYLLTANLDFNGVTYTIKNGSFEGLLNGMGHTVSNVNVESKSGNTGVFYKVAGGTIENIKFNNISISAKGTKVGLVSQTTGGYFYNIAMTNVSIVSTDARIGGLIGQVDPGTIVCIDQVSLNNDENHKLASNATKDNRVGGIVGFTQAGGSLSSGAIDIRISNCYVNTVIETYAETGGIFGTYDGGSNPNVTYNLEIRSCVFAGTIIGKHDTKTYIGGILGYQKGAYTNMTITGCVSIGKIYFLGKLVDVAQKNCSGIVGCFNNILANGIVAKVDNCVALMEEYNNAEFEVGTLKNGLEYAGTLATKLDTEFWTYIYKDGSTTELKAPFVSLNFFEVEVDE